VLQLASVEVSGRVQLGLVLDISTRGLSLRLSIAAQAGQQIKVCLREFVIEGTIAWFFGGKAGVTFFDELLPEVLTGLLRPFEPRMRAPRLVTDLKAKIRLGAAVHQASLQNISPSGAMLAVELYSADKEQVVVTLPQVGPIPGQIRWCDGTRIGVLFNRALSLNDLGSILACGHAWSRQTPWSNRT
jgi:hypothetical protein